MLVQMNPARGLTCARLWFGIAVIVVLVVFVVAVVVASFGVVVLEIRLRCRRNGAALQWCNAL